MSRGVARQREDADGAMVREIGPGAGWNSEISCAFQLARALSDAVSVACEDGALPIVISGNCGVALGILAGLRRASPDARDPSLIWLDAHGDVHTPETTRSGFLDGMALSIVLGRCWSTLAARIEGYRPQPVERVVHIGGRDFDDGEAGVLAQSASSVVPPFAATTRAIDALAEVIDAQKDQASPGAYLHIDLDVLDPIEGRANSYAALGGLSAGSLLEIVELVRDELGIAALALTAYDPSCDPDSRVADVAVLAARAAASSYRVRTSP